MQAACKCNICQSAEHSSNLCPELLKELKPGFYKPSRGMPQGGGDEEDSLRMNFLTRKERYNKNEYDFPFL